MNDYVAHPWSSESILLKAKRYSERMLSHESSSWEYGLWSCFVLELLGRAVLAKTSPVLIADNQDWNNLAYAIGSETTTKKFQPKSITTATVFSRIEALHSVFTREMVNFCAQHLNRRNAELHTGDLAFDGLGNSKWLPEFYEASKTLLGILGEDLSFLFGPEEAGMADHMINAMHDEDAKAVGKQIAARKQVWKEYELEEKRKLSSEAMARATRNLGHRDSCPACGNTALVHGHPAGAAIQSLDEGFVVEKQKMLPSTFECFACGLKIAGFSKLKACGLGDTFTATIRYDPADYFDIEPIYVEVPSEEPDFNEF